MYDTSKIEAKIAGAPVAKQRRAELVAQLGQAFEEGGPQAVTNEVSKRVDLLVDAFSGELQELKKQI